MVVDYSFQWFKGGIMNECPYQESELEKNDNHNGAIGDSCYECNYLECQHWKSNEDYLKVVKSLRKQFKI